MTCTMTQNRCPHDHLVGTCPYCEATPAVTTSWAGEVVADSGGKWTGNDLRFATEDEAQQYAQDLAMRWTAVSDWRAVESTDPVNCKLEADGSRTNV